MGSCEISKSSQEMSFVMSVWASIPQISPQLPMPLISQQIFALSGCKLVVQRKMALTIICAEEFLEIVISDGLKEMS